MKNHGEWLSAVGESQERAKCLFLASAGAVKKNAVKVLTQCRQMAKRFLETYVLSGDELVPEPILYAFELAHNASSRDHPQARPLFLYFAPDELADSELVYVMADRKGHTRVEVYTGMMYDGEPTRRGFVLCARHHAVELLMPAMTPAEFSAFCVQVLRCTGLPVARYHMLGWRAMFDSLKQFPGQTPLARPSELRACEQCPSETAPKVRLAPRRGVGAVAEDVMTEATAETAVAGLAATGTIALGAASDAREDAVSGALGVLFGVGSSSDVLAGVRPSEPIVRATRVSDAPMGVGRTVAFSHQCDGPARWPDLRDAQAGNCLNLGSSSVSEGSGGRTSATVDDEARKLASFRRRSAVLSFAVTHYELPDGLAQHESSVMGDDERCESSVLPADKVISTTAEPSDGEKQVSGSHFRRPATCGAVSPSI